MAKHNETGEIGEGIACRFLVKRGFQVLERNYRKKWGEIDIIAQKSGILMFIEVKTVTRNGLMNVSRETLAQDRPEEKVHPWKLKRLYRTITSYLFEKRVSRETFWQFGIIAVFLDRGSKTARIRFSENVVM